MIWKCNVCQNEMNVTDGTQVCFCPKCGAKAGTESNAVSLPARATSLERFAARSIDVTLESWAIVLIWGLFIGVDNPHNMLLLIIIITPIVFLLDSLVYAVCGNTLGKKIFGIMTVEENTGLKVSAGRYFLRNLYVYFAGYGLGIVPLITFVGQWYRVSNGKATTYDEKMKLNTIRPNPSGLRTFIGYAVFILLMFLNAVLNVI